MTAEVAFVLEVLPWGLFAITVGLALVCARRWRWNESVWLKLDLFTLCIAVASILTLSGELRRALSTTRIPYAEIILASRLDIVSEEATRCARRWLDPSTYSQWKHQDDVDAYMEFGRWCRDVASSTSTLEDSDDLRSWRIHTGHSPPQGWRSVVILGEHQDILTALSNAEEQLRVVDSLRQHLAYTPTEIMTMFLLLILLPIALAFPITQAIAKLRRWNVEP